MNKSENKGAFDGAKKLFGEKEKLAKVVLILGIAGMALIFASELYPKQKINEKSAYCVAEISYDREQRLEKRLEAIIEKINGAGKTKVMITLDSSNEYFYAFESKTDIAEKESERQSSAEEAPAVIDGKNGEEPLITKVGESGVRGVAVVCEGGDNPQVAERIINAVCAVLGIKSSRVSVAGMA